jgi:DNA (cytosine-5)-methyltransferase 1
VLTGLDIFCGAGGSSAGAHAAGIRMIGAIDRCPIATATYKANFPDTTVITGRLEDLNIWSLKRKLGPVDILLASPECTNHTCAKGARPRDESSRATAMHAVEYARVFRPRWLVLENVVHMRPWFRYEELKKNLVQLGYRLAEQVLDATNFGVAQSRRRLFLVGDLARTPHLVSSRRTAKRKNAATILDPQGSWKTVALYSDRRAAATLERARRGFDSVGPNGSFLIVYYGSDGSGGWQPLDRPLRTVTTIDRFALVTQSRNGPVMRMLQVPELRRAMGFAKSFRLPVGTRRDRVKLLGNGVCPPVMRAVVRALISEDTNL